MSSELDKILQNIDVPDFEAPIGSFTILGITFTMWKKPELSLTLCETSPYEPKGNVI